MENKEAEHITFNDIVFYDKWALKDGNYKVFFKAGVVPGKILFFDIKRIPNSIYFDEIFSLVKEIYKHERIIDYQYIVIAEYSALDTISLLLHRQYAQIFRKLIIGVKSHPKISYICGANSSNQTVMTLLSDLEGQDFRFVSTIEEAFSSINNPEVSEDKGNEEYRIYKKDLLELSNYVADLLWNEFPQDINRIALSDSNPLKPLEKSLQILRREVLDLLLREKNRDYNFKRNLDSLPIPLFLVNLKNRDILHINKAAAQLLRKDEDEIVHKTMDSFFENDIVGDISSEKQSEQIRDFIKFRDGRFSPVLKNYNILSYEGQMCILISLFDLSGIQLSSQDWKEYYAILKDNEERLSLAMQASNEGIWDWNLHDDWLNLSSQIYTMAGYKNGEFPSNETGYTKLIHPDDISKIPILIEKLSSLKEDHYSWDVRFLRKNNSYMWIHSECKIVDYDENGNPSRIIGVVRDVDNAKKREMRSTLLHSLQSKLLLPMDLQKKMKAITDMVVKAGVSDFSRVWLLKEADSCNTNCFFKDSEYAAKYCKEMAKCLHLISSSGMYTHLDGEHSRIPVGALKIGKMLTHDYDSFLINDLSESQEILNPQWVEEQGLKSFAGFKLRDELGSPIGVFASFARMELNEENRGYLESLANLASLVVINNNANEELKIALLQEEKANALMQGRENRIRQLKHEVNELCFEMGDFNRYDLKTSDNETYKDLQPDLMEARANALSIAEDAEIARREAEEMTEQLSIIKQAVSHSSDAVGISTISGDLFYINHTFTELLGYKITQLAVYAHELLFSDEEVYNRALSSALSGSPWQGQVEMFCFDDTPIPILMRTAPFFDDKKKIVGVVWNFTDIREQVEHERRIAQYTKTIEDDLERQKQILKKARLLQKTLIQTDIPLLRDFNLHALFMPCEELGGDFFRIIKGIYYEKLIIIVGDCTGHGIKASMDASLLASLVDKQLKHLYLDNRTDIFLNSISTQFMEIADEDQYPTLFVSIVDLLTGEMHYSNANGELPCILRDGKVMRLNRVRGMHLGYFEDPDYERKNFSFLPGDRVYFFSDAVTEIPVENHNLLGYEGFSRIIGKAEGRAESQFDEIVDSLKELNHRYPLDDDTTLIQLEYKPMRDGIFRFSKLKQSEGLWEEIRVLLEEYNYSIDGVEKLNIALHEICTNAFVHGNRSDEKKTVHVAWFISNKEVQMEIVDEGEGFDPEAVTDPVKYLEEIMERDDEEEYTHGRGLWIVRTMMDRLEFNEKGNGVTLLLKKKKEELREFRWE